MKLTFKTKGNIEIDYRVWLDNSEKEVEKATIMVIDRYSDLVVDKYSVQEKIMNNKKEYLAAMLSCRPENVEVTDCDIKCSMVDSEFTLSGTFEFDVDDEDEIMVGGLPSDDEICENIKTLVYESIHEHRDFVDGSRLRNKLNDKFWNIVEVDFYYDYKSTHFEVNLER
jgi:hypothetical protein